LTWDPEACDYFARKPAGAGSVNQAITGFFPYQWSPLRSNEWRPSQQQGQHNQAILYSKSLDNPTIPEFLTGIGIRQFADPFAVVIFIGKEYHRTAPLSHYFLL